MTSMPGFDLDFIRRVYITTGIAGVLMGLMLFPYNPVGAYSFLAGLAFGIANFWAWSKFIQAVLKVGEIKPREAVLTFIIKFPIILVLFFIVLYEGWVEPVWYVAGFSLTYLVILLKVLAIIIFKPRVKPPVGIAEPEGSSDDGDSA
jgi:fatty acid desaturase